MMVVQAADTGAEKCRKRLDSIKLWNGYQRSASAHLYPPLHNRATISTAQIIERPQSGTAAADGTTRFQPNADFTGK
jgi:hypothetical protein